MKYVILVGDGMGDYALPELDNQTILEAARIPNMDALAAGGLLGLAATIPPDKEPGSDVANMSIMGYDPSTTHSGRGPLEAGSMGVRLKPDEQAFRMNLVTLEQKDGRVFMRDHSAGHVSTEDAAVLIERLAAELPLHMGQTIHPGVSYRHLLVWPGLEDGLPTIPPHDYRDRDVTAYLDDDTPGMKPIRDLIKASWPILENHPLNLERIRQGKRPANSVWPWGQGRPPVMATYRERWGLNGAVISAVDLIKGLGVYAGLTPMDVPGATGLVDTNYEGKVAAALEALREGDFVLIHVEAPDEAGHQGDVQTKLRAVELFDQKVVGPMWSALKERGDYRLLVLCDHFTPIALKTHTREPVPFILHPAQRPSGRAYTEAEASRAGLYLDSGHRLVDLLFGDDA